MGKDGETIVGANSTNPGASLLEKAQQFSVFAVQHVEEVRQALIGTADTPQSWINDDSSNDFGRKNGVEIAAAFEELSAAYSKLSSLKWDAARMDFEDGHRIQARFTALNNSNVLNGVKNGKVEKKVKVMPVTDEGEVVFEASGGVKDDPWQENDMNPHDWIADAFLKSAISNEDDDEGGDNLPVNGHLASLNATATPFPTTPLTANTASTPPGFKPESAAQKVETNDGEVQQGDGSAHTKSTVQSLTFLSSEISSLHTSSQPNTDEDVSDDDEVSDSDYSDTSSLSEELPSMDNFDYLYKGGYAMQVSGGKETKGVVPKTVKRVLVDSSVKCIEEGAFQGCNMLETITIPSSVEAVRDNAFRKCSKLKSVIFLTKAPKSRRREQKWDRQKRDEKKEDKSLYHRSASAPPSVTEPRYSDLRCIGDWAFFNCSSLGSVQLPHGLESIGARAFQRCSSMSLAFGNLPKTLTSVGENAFIGCPPQTKASFERWEKEQSTLE